ncbi:MAG TPA: hypothetical protein VFZ21_11625, partial [Gemmatimonadaceae bacterium]|nr:hypothetical protein [Gemmatimonadaceae bacterium]
FCAAIAPEAMAMDGHGKAYPRSEIVNWCSADGEFVRQCPTEAIAASRIVPGADQPIAQKEVA